MDNAVVETPEPVKSPGATLADEMYAPPAVTEPDPKPEAVTEDPKPEAEPVEAQVEEQEEQEEQEATQEVESSESSDDEIEVTTMEQLAEHLETDPDWLRGLKITEKVNGKPVEVSISDALRTHRQVAAGDDYLADAKTKAKTLIESSTQEKETVAAAVVTIGALLQSAEAALGGGMTEAEWAKLRKDDPAEWSARQKEAQDKTASINALKQQASSVFADTKNKIEQHELTRRNAALPKEREIFLDKVPAWKDPEVFEKEAGEISEYLTSQGLNTKEVETICYKGVYLAMARAAMMHERSKGKVAAAKKKVVKIPKIMKPGKSAEDTKPKGGGDDPVSILYGPT